MSKPINIPLFESDPEDLRRQLDEIEVPSFFKFGSEEDLGLVSYGRFLIFVTLLSIPSEQLSVAYHMSCGRNFKHPELRADGLKYTNLDFILSRHVKTRDHGYLPGHHSKTSLLRHLFGQDLERTMSFEEFQQLHSDLKREVLKLEYYLLSDREGGMSLVGFAKAVAALTPSEYRSMYEERAENMRHLEVPAEYLIKREPLLGEEYDPPLETLEGFTAEDCYIALEEYGSWKEALKQVELMEQAIRMYQHRDGHFTPSGLMRAAKAVANVDLTKAQVWVLFKLFDTNADEKLQHEEFVRLLIPYSVLQGKLPGPDGLGLEHLYSCCSQCFKDWYVYVFQRIETHMLLTNLFCYSCHSRYDGTIAVDEETLVED